MLTVACVNVGNKYDVDYVDRLHHMVSDNLPARHQFVCLTDRPRSYNTVEINISKERLSGWWAKLKLFDPEFRREFGNDQWLYFDLDTVILRDISKLAAWRGSFAICENFTRLAGNTSWPCAYGSCVMSFGPGFGGYVWEQFNKNRDWAISGAPKGDQQFIEQICPNVPLLQHEMPKGYFVGYRDLTTESPASAAVVIFAGNHKPHNSPYPWVRKAWG